MKVHFHLQKCRRCRQRQRGAVALTIVIAALIIMSIAVLGVRQSLEFGWEENTYNKMRFQAKLLAESGLALATHPDISPGDTALTREHATGGKIEVSIGTEGGHILINAIEDDVIEDTVRELFILWGLDATEATIAVDSLHDWVDDNSRVRTNGAENDYYTAEGYSEFPLNEPFVSLEQMTLVRGMDRVARAKPDWRNYFTLYGDGTIDVHEAPADLLEAFFATNETAAENFVRNLTGPDGIENTDDDVRYDSLDDVRNSLGLPEETMTRVENWAGVSNTVKRIKSKGIVGDFTYTLIVLIEEGDAENPVELARIEQRTLKR